nr:unnamed protein product [Callosobruchus chinensis]
MATANNFVSLGDLSSRDCGDNDKMVFERIKGLIEVTLPEGWKNWKVIDWSKEELLGKSIDHKVLNKIRFALPTLEMVKAFYPEASTVGEKTYRNIKLTLLNWDICRALIMGPHHLAARLRGSSSQVELFNKAVEVMKPSLLSREQVSEALSTDAESQRSPRRKRSHSTSSGSSALTSASEEIVPQTVTRRKRKWRKSSTDQDEASTESRLNRLEGMIEGLIQAVSSNKENRSSEDVTSWRAPSPCFSFQVGNEQNPNVEAQDWDIFSPITKESEPAIPRADPLIEKQGLKCQRFGEASWNKIRYNETQKKLHASPVFGSLRVNPILSHNAQPSGSRETLAKCDLALGTIVHGLLLQRSRIQESLKKVAEEHPESAESLRKLLEVDSEFRVISDDLLQYTCGKRAEIIEARRRLYEPMSKYYRSILNEIPPSGSFLWDEEKLQDAVRSHGMSKFTSLPRRSHSKIVEKESSRPKSVQEQPKKFQQRTNKVKRLDSRSQKPFKDKESRKYSFKERNKSEKRHF